VMAMQFLLPSTKWALPVTRGIVLVSTRVLATSHED